jgi:hypothetical protein
MLHTMSYQVYKNEHGLPVSAAEQRAADERAGEVAAALHELWRCLGRAARREQRAEPAREAQDAAPARFMSAVR